MTRAGFVTVRWYVRSGEPTLVLVITDEDGLAVLEGALEAQREEPRLVRFSELDRVVCEDGADLELSAERAPQLRRIHPTQHRFGLGGSPDDWLARADLVRSLRPVEPDTFQYLDYEMAVGDAALLVEIATA